MARNFTTTTDKVSIADNAALDITGALTLYCWVYLNAGSVYHSLINKSNGTGATNTPYDFRTNNQASPTIFLGRSGGAGTGRNSTLTVSTLTWTHLAVTDMGDQTANNCKFYKNAGTPDLATANIASTANAKPVLIGERDDALGGNCRIAWVGIHNVILTQEEIAEAMYRGFTMRGLVGCWPLFGDATEPDLSGNLLNGTVTGTAIVEGPPVSPLWYRPIQENIAALKNENFGYPGQNFMIGGKFYHNFIKSPRKTGVTGREGFNLNDLTPEGS